ncbi:MAG: hypothetical protein AAFV45_04515 [Pseudomonadota bacterium]
MTKIISTLAAAAALSLAVTSSAFALDAEKFFEEQSKYGGNIETIFEDQAIYGENIETIWEDQATYGG